MSTKAYFSNLRRRVVSRAENSQKEVIISTPYFSSKEVFSVLMAKTQADLSVRIVLSANDINASLPWEQLIEKGGKIQLIKDDSFSYSGESIFLFDRKTLLTGNYNLTDQAEYSDLHSLIEILEPNTLKQYLNRFKQVLEISTSFDRKYLVTESALKQREEKVAALERELEEELYRTLTMVKVNNLPLSADEIMHDVDTFGAVGTLRRHIMKDRDEVFQVLVEHGFVNRTFESMVAQDKYHHLFAAEVVKKAKERVS